MGRRESRAVPSEIKRVQGVSFEVGGRRRGDVSSEESERRTWLFVDPTARRVPSLENEVTF